MKRLMPVVVMIPVALFTMAGCPKNQAAPSALPDGSTKITDNMVGQWKAPGGTSCRWWMQTKAGVITNNGNTTGPVSRRKQKKGKAADQSQSVIIGHGNIDEYLKSDKCTKDSATGVTKGWTQ